MSDFCLPFRREFRWSQDCCPSDLIRGKDVYLLQSLLSRFSSHHHRNLSSRYYQLGVYDSWTARDVDAFCSSVGVESEPQVFNGAASTALLESYGKDGYRCPFSHGQVDRLPEGFKYLIHVPVRLDRSIETRAQLFDSEMSPLHRFLVRAHGQGPRNEFTLYGSTPTGLYVADHQKPEPDAGSFGPGCVQRLLYGIEGNAQICCGVGRAADFALRCGLLLHTGQWEGWDESMPMPNSHGCLKVHPGDMDRINELMDDIEVRARENLLGNYLPYPYEPQGLISVELVQGDGDLESS